MLKIDKGILIMVTKKKQAPQATVAQNPLLLRAQRLMEAFAKSDDERDFFLDNREGFIVFVDLDKSEEELQSLHDELDNEPERYFLIPKPTFFEIKKIMESFVNEKVYDIDTKEKLLDIIQSKDSRENFLNFLYDQILELEKWQQFYQERSRIRIIEWLRENGFQFVFEEDLEFAASLLEKIKMNLFEKNPDKEVEAARKIIIAKSKSYYTSEALNPRPKRGRPPKKAIKAEFEPQISVDLYTTVPKTVRPFLFIPDSSHPSAATFSARYDDETELLASKRNHSGSEARAVIENLNRKLASLRSLGSEWLTNEDEEENEVEISELDSFDDEDDEDEFDALPPTKGSSAKSVKKAKPANGKNVPASKNKAVKKEPPVKKAPSPQKVTPIKKPVPPKKAIPSKKTPPPKKKK